MDRRIKFRHLQAFVAIIRQQSLKAAAAQLNLTQPAISKTLRDLETHVGAPLLLRDRGGVSLTPQGEVFLQYAEMSLNALTQGMASLSEHALGKGGRLAVGALPSVAAKVLPAALSRFSDLSPGTVVQIEDGPHGYLVDRLRAGSLDLVIGRLGKPETMGAVSFSQLYSEHVVAVVAPGHPLAGSRDLAAIADWPVVYPSAGAAIRPLVDRLLLAEGITALPQRIESVSGALGRALVLSDIHAVWLISHGVVAGDLDSGRLAAMQADTTLTAGPVGIMARADDDLSPPARQFRRAISDAVADLGLS